MIINLLGSCDRRPLLYTIMKVCQGLGDVLIVSDDTHLLRLSDTGATQGHYQNTMIVVTQEGIDTFAETFGYSTADFEFIIYDGLMATNADVYFYCRGRCVTEDEKELISYIDNPITCDLYSSKAAYFDSQTIYKLEDFEAYRNMTTISSKLAKDVAKVLSPVLGWKADALYKIAMQNITAAAPKKKLLGRR